MLFSLDNCQPYQSTHLKNPDKSFYGVLKIMISWRGIRYITITGLCLAGSTEVACIEKWLEKIWQERYFQNARKKGIQAGFGTV
jgi:hypothetical protein